MRLKDLFEDNGGKASIEQRLEWLFGKQDAHELMNGPVGAVFLRDRRGNPWKVLKNQDGSIELLPDYMMEDNEFSPINEAKELAIPDAIRHTMPKTLIFPDMDLYYEYYKFVKGMACHPELRDGVVDDKSMRDVPMAVAYTPQEYDMIMSVAKRMGKKVKEIGFGGSHEPPGANTVSPVMKFNMYESTTENMRGLMEKLNETS